jgi:hypothetical protein
MRSRGSRAQPLREWAILLGERDGAIDDKGTEQTGEARTKEIPWKKWGPYLTERQWGSVREDYSEDGNAWNYFTHDQARSRTYR